MTQEQLKDTLYDIISAYFDTAQVVWGMTKAVRAHNPTVCLVLGTVARPYQPVKRVVNGVPVHAYPSRTTLQVDLYTSGKSPVFDEIDTELNYEGEESEDEDGGESAVHYIVSPANTAVSDLTGFTNFLNSDFVEEWTGRVDITVISSGQVQDLTSGINDASWDYRAMVELEIFFTEVAVGFTAANFDDGQPYYSNGIPHYDDEGYLQTEEGLRVPDLSPLETGENGKYIYPDFEPTPSGGGSQRLANLTTGWFDKIESPEFIRRNNNVK